MKFSRSAAFLCFMGDGSGPSNTYEGLSEGPRSLMKLEKVHKQEYKRMNGGKRAQ